MKLSYDIYICGVGGQGIIKAGEIIGWAAMKEGMNVVMSEIHGMAQRGGGVSTNLRIGKAKGTIIPNGHADLMMAFEPLEALRAIDKIKKDAHLVVNLTPIPPFNINPGEYPPVDEIIMELKKVSRNVYAFDADRMALEAGHPLSMNMAILGAATATPNFPLSQDVIIESMKENLPSRFFKVNLKAFKGGFMSLEG
ncbi:MAG TPA: indolepyruvate oxidoreductase subunit beta [Methanothermobacter sp.]|uniref:Indolepyruvate ferredoxin oxidoreductase subunit beta n=1 Tax=Methanothermobacter tenebrarum TaxID=680118 RepID=A0ABM7YF23_9EURY|nr:indolepyruvate oxidoreductase subunit beta [Methanothermobacter tenebrarum]MDX9693325.1 indolepyruvate oxidoreductase subunit beta [Methanothermobacter sp.]BDH79910.1 indolepyruvate oxidoreductase [Methanothermobacter tenebrarum]HHW16853.1 indolepyruvate oxidoreductase subunit beta [Methanothermobacter sp.]